MRFSRLVVVALVGLVLLAIRGRSVYTDWLWFGEVGYQPVFSTIWATQGLLFVAAFVTSVAWFGLNIRVAVSSLGDRRPTFVTREGPAVPFPEPAQIRQGLMAVAMVVSLLFGLAAASSWETWLAWRHQGPFAGPIRSWASMPPSTSSRFPCGSPSVGTAQALVVLLRWPPGALFRHRRLDLRLPVAAVGSRARPPASCALVAVFFLLLAAAWLRRAEHLLQPTAMFFGATYADVAARMPAALLLVGACLVGAALCGLARADVPQLAHSGRPGSLRAGGHGHRDLRRRGAAVRGDAQRAGPREPAHSTQHRCDPPGLRARRRRGTRAERRCHADTGRHRAEQRDARERAAVGPPAAARDVRPDSGDPHLLRLRLRGQRPLPREREPAAGDAVGPRAELRQPSEPDLGQRAADLHARLRPHAGTREPGDRRRAAGALRAGLAAGGLRGLQRRAAQHLLRRAVERLRRRPDRHREFHYPKGEDNVFTMYDGRPAVVIDSLCGSCSSRCASARISWC